MTYLPLHKSQRIVTERYLKLSMTRDCLKVTGSAVVYDSVVVFTSFCFPGGVVVVSCFNSSSLWHLVLYSISG